MSVISIRNCLISDNFFLDEMFAKLGFHQIKTGFTLTNAVLRGGCTFSRPKLDTIYADQHSGRSETSDYWIGSPPEQRNILAVIIRGENLAQSC